MIFIFLKKLFLTSVYQNDLKTLKTINLKQKNIKIYTKNRLKLPLKHPVLTRRRSCRQCYSMIANIAPYRLSHCHAN